MLFVFPKKWGTKRKWIIFFENFSERNIFSINNVIFRLTFEWKTVWNNTFFIWNISILGYLPNYLIFSRFFPWKNPFFFLSEENIAGTRKNGEIIPIVFLDKNIAGTRNIRGFSLTEWRPTSPEPEILGDFSLRKRSSTSPEPVFLL